MPRQRGPDRYVTNVAVTFVATYRATLQFFAKREAVMADYYPDPFPHWQRGERHFNLISTDTRRVIRFEPNRFIVRAEGHPTMKPYDEVIAIARRLFETFDARDLFGAAFTLVRARSLPAQREARSKFAKLFLSDLSQALLPEDGVTDYAVTLSRSWTASTDLLEMKPAMAPLRIKHDLSTGPSDYREAAERFCEFTKDADNELYKTEHVAPEHSILAAVRLSLDRHTAKQGVAAPIVWKFHDWARSDAEVTWAKIEGALQ